MDNPPAPPKLNPKQWLAIAAFCSGLSTNKAVAERVGVNPITVGKWMKKPEFREALEEAQQKQLELITIAMLNASDKAMAAIHEAFDFASDTNNIDVSSLFVKKKVMLPESGEKIELLVLDIDKIKKSGRFIKKIKSNKDGLEVEVFDAVQAKNLGLRAAELVLSRIPVYKDQADNEARIQALEDKLDNTEEDDA